MGHFRGRSASSRATTAAALPPTLVTAIALKSLSTKRGRKRPKPCTSCHTIYVRPICNARYIIVTYSLAPFFVGRPGVCRVRAEEENCRSRASTVEARATDAVAGDADVTVDVPVRDVGGHRHRRRERVVGAERNGEGYTQAASHRRRALLLRTVGFAFAFLLVVVCCCCRCIHMVLMLRVIRASIV